MMQIFDCAQRSDEWYRRRLGIPTASMFATVMRAKGRGDDGDSKTRQKYARQIAAEILTGEPTESFDNAHMERGRMMEDEARALYTFLADEPLTQVGFIRDDDKGAGCSPDSLVGERGLLEIKTALPDILIDYIVKGEFPPLHRAQCQGALWLSDREWVDICIYWPTMPEPFIKRAPRDEPFIVDLAKAVISFNEEVAGIVERVRRYGKASSLKDDLNTSLRLMAG